MRIRRIIGLQRIGILSNAVPGAAIDLGQATIIYAENGCGKTTLASIIEAWRLRDVRPMAARKTIGATADPTVDLLLQDGQHVALSGGTWTGPVANVAVFDLGFVERNVCSGQQVRADQRQALLDFALGDQAVAAKRDLEQLVDEIEAQTRRRTQASHVLAPLSGPHTVADYAALRPPPDIDRLVEGADARASSARNAPALLVREDPVALTTVTFDVDAAFGVLSTDLEVMSADAEARVKAHIEHHEAAHFEEWLSQGQRFAEAADCPFCGQAIQGLPLVAAYQSYFGEAYGDLKVRLQRLKESVISDLGDVSVDGLSAAALTNQARVDAWRDRLDLVAPVIDRHEIAQALSRARNTLLDLIASKETSPMGVVGSQADREAVGAALASFGQIVRGYNAAIGDACDAIGDEKEAIRRTDAQTAETEVVRLRAAQARLRTDVDEAAAEYLGAEHRKGELEAAKTEARRTLDAEMERALGRYKERINELLRDFGAEFSIERLAATYIGGEPRAEYRLSVRGRPVPLASRTQPAMEPCFSTALSESDKRALALAFFFARLEVDPDLGSKVVIVDDPMSSLDRGRRRKSLLRLVQLAPTCEQLIVLTHDSRFARELRDALADPGRGPGLNARVLELHRVAGGAAFADCNIDEICASAYHRNYRIVADFVAGTGTANPRDVAEAVRTVLEGYYHRKFPNRIPRRAMLGHVISASRDAQPPDPLVHLQPSLQELSDLNDFASQFHHDDDTEIPPLINEAELRTYAQLALDLVHRAGR